MKKDQLLFTLDKREYEAQLLQAKAQLAKAQADLAFAQDNALVESAKANLDVAIARLGKAETDERRLKPLAERRAVPQQDYDDAVAKLNSARAEVESKKSSVNTSQVNLKSSIEQAEAAIAAARAAIVQAELNVSYCTIRSPIEGLIGKRLVSPGNLVGKGEPTLLDTVSRIDPIRVAVTISEAEYLYLPEAQRLCRKYGVQFICDEVQVGLGRAGKFLCCEDWNLEPDMVTIAKSLGGGYMPTSTVIMRREINNKVFGHLKRAQIHSTTFGQNDMSMAAGLATLHVMDEEKIVERSATVGEKLLAKLTSLKDRHEMIADVRGKGLIIGIEFRPPSSFGLKAAWTAIETAEKGLSTQLIVMSLMRDHHILTHVGGAGVNIIKLLPPLIIGDEGVGMIVTAFDAILDETKNVRGRVWGTSGELIKQALSS